ncbi:MAG: hypothetical protein Kow0042_14550 [Calditrichia bacterium]
MIRLNKSQKRLLWILLLVVGYAAFDIIQNFDSYASTYGFKRKKSEQVNPSVEKPVQEMESLTRKTYNKGWNSDPFYVPVVEKKVRKVSRPQSVYLELNAISFATENSVAMINNRIVKVGDSIAGYRVSRIEPRRVVLIKGGQTRVLSLK